METLPNLDRTCIAYLDVQTTLAVFATRLSAYQRRKFPRSFISILVLTVVLDAVVADTATGAEDGRVTN